MAADSLDAQYDYDLVVIGGGSGGLACAKEAADLKKRVAVLDFVKPSPRGTTWGLGGTCVNVGCIPKKMFHTAAIMGETLKDMPFYGWNAGEIKHDWATLSATVIDHIKGLNWGSANQLKLRKVDYFNMFGRFIDQHTIELTSPKSETKRITSANFVIAVGGRPSPLGVPGEAEYTMSSDDLFFLPKPPGKTLVIGASYVALECAGFLNGLGCETAVMVRSVPLRMFDADAGRLISERMKHLGVRFIQPATPTSFAPAATADAPAAADAAADAPTPAPQRIVVSYHHDTDGDLTEEFDTVLVAVGRQAVTGELGLENIGLKAERNGKLKVVNEQTAVPNVYAIGDVIDGRPELTPVAKSAGVLLARRLFGGSTVQMDYDSIPTTVFTPLEYGTCGLSEQEAVARYGADNVDVYHVEFQHLEMTPNYNRYDEFNYIKVLTLRTDSDRILGFHVFGPNAGEVTQGFGMMLKLKATKADLDSLVGIHPTFAEEFTGLTTTKRSAKDPRKSEC